MSRENARRSLKWGASEASENTPPSKAATSAKANEWKVQNPPNDQV